MPDDTFALMTGAAGPAPGVGTLLTSASTVIHACKQDGVRLAVLEDADGHLKLKGETEIDREGWGPLVRLWSAFTRDQIHYGDPRDAGVSSLKSNWLVPQRVHESLSGRLADECSDIRRLSTLPITRSFVYVDVSDFSQHRPGQQALIVGSLVSMVWNWRYWNRDPSLFAWRDLEAMLCIGDGYIFVLKDVVAATYFAAHLAQLIEVRVARKLVPVGFHFRMGVHVGPVFCFWDWGRGGRDELETVTEKEGGLQRTERGDWNYIGDGINGGQRVLAAVGKKTDDVLFISGQVRQELTARDDGTALYRQVLNNLLNRGRQADKHNKFWRVYEVNHSGLCGPQLPEEATR